MEILSYNSVLCSNALLLRRKCARKNLNPSCADLSGLRRRRVSCARIKTRSKFLGSSDLEQVFLKTSHHSKCSCLEHPHESSQPKFTCRSASGYVIDGEEGSRSIPESGESTTKVQIPGLPDEPNSESSAPISSCFWEWKPKLSVHYEKAGCENVNSPPLLFLPGFGVGSFHYEKQLKDLGRDYRVWAIDFLGQGMSLPVEDPTSNSEQGNESDGKDSAWGFGDETVPWASELVYSIDLWQDQVRYFIEEVIGEPVYIVGNSLGGFVALYFAANYPHLVKGITLLNATPFWGFLPNPKRSPRLAKMFPWSGKFPLPDGVRKLTKFVWQKISDPESIGDILRQVYADHTTKVDDVFGRIVQTTQHPAAAASFASIMFAPQGQLSFWEALSRCHMNSVPVCLMYGKEDPWVKPIWGLAVKRRVPEAPYYEISPAGHCPHDEVPEVVNFLLRGWIRNLETGGSVGAPLVGEAEAESSSVVKDLEYVREGSKRSVSVRLYGSTSSLSLLNQITSFFKTVQIKS